MPELKRLQGFPDDFEITGSRGSVQLQVGNSVPPALGAIVATAVREQLEGKIYSHAPDQLPLLAAQA